jgi:hypothetical protein
MNDLIQNPIYVFSIRATMDFWISEASNQLSIEDEHRNFTNTTSKRCI